MTSTALATGLSPMITRAAAAWNGVRLTHWGALPGELTEHSYSDHEINIPLYGNLTTMKHTASGGRRPCYGHAGMICIVPAGQPVMAHWRDEVECVTISLKPSLLECAALNERSPARVELVETYDTEDQLIRQIGLALLAEVVAREPLGRLYAESLASALVMHLVRRYSVSRRAPEAFRGGLSGNKLRRAQEFINEHLEQELTLFDIANAVGLSQFHFSRAFKRTTGLTPQQYLTECRIEHAKRLLDESDLPLVEVGARAGFKNQSHFTSLFRRFTAMTPKAWREAKRASGATARLI